MLALDLSEQRYFSCIAQTVGLGPSPFEWKSFPNICGTLLGEQIGAGWRWVRQSSGRKLEVPLGQDELVLSFLTSAKPHCFGRPEYLLRWWDKHKLHDGTMGEKKFLKHSRVLFKNSFSST